jgi:hypothetical protein
MTIPDFPAMQTFVGASHRSLSVARFLLISGCIGFLCAALAATSAAAEVYFSDSAVEILGTGTRVSRNCTIVLKPNRTLGDSFAPRLALMISGPSRLSFGLETPAQYSNAVVVQNNVRRPLLGSENASIEQFRLSDIVKILKSQRLFFITAQRSDSGKFVSSRYESVDFNSIMAKVERVCPFDAESLMTNLSEREQAERALTISLSDLTFIRWALNKKYGGSSNRPDPAASLSTQERTYLKRYAGENGLPLSQYLTADIARKLTVEGQLIAGISPSSAVLTSAPVPVHSTVMISSRGCPATPMIVVAAHATPIQRAGLSLLTSDLMYAFRKQAMDGPNQALKRYQPR